MKRVVAVIAASLLLVLLTGCGESDDADKRLNEQYHYCIDHGGSFSQSEYGRITCDMSKGTK